MNHKLNSYRIRLFPQNVFSTYSPIGKNIAKRNLKTHFHKTPSMRYYNSIVSHSHKGSPCGPYNGFCFVFNKSWAKALNFLKKTYFLCTLTVYTFAAACFTTYEYWSLRDAETGGIEKTTINNVLFARRK